MLFLAVVIVLFLFVDSIVTLFISFLIYWNVKQDSNNDMMVEKSNQEVPLEYQHNHADHFNEQVPGQHMNEPGHLDAVGYQGEEGIALRLDDNHGGRQQSLKVYLSHFCPYFYIISKWVLTFYVCTHLHFFFYNFISVTFRL